MKTHLLHRLPIDETKEFLDNQKTTTMDDVSLEILRSELKNLPLYKKTKAELVKVCKDENITVNGTTKVDIALEILKHRSFDIEGLRASSKLKYNGDLSTIPVLSSQVRDLGE